MSQTGIRCDGRTSAVVTGQIEGNETVTGVTTASYDGVAEPGLKESGEFDGFDLDPAQIAVMPDAVLVESE